MVGGKIRRSHSSEKVLRSLRYFWLLATFFTRHELISLYEEDRYSQLKGGGQGSDFWNEFVICEGLIAENDLELEAITFCFLAQVASAAQLILFLGRDDS